MSIDIPLSFEKSIEQFAQAQRITRDEAFARIFQAGLEHSLPKTSPRDLLSAFATPEECATMDEAMDIAMKDRERRNSESPHA